MTSMPRRSSSSRLATTCFSSDVRPSVSTAGCSSSSNWSVISVARRAAARSCCICQAARYGTRPSQRTSKASVSAMSATISHRAFTTSAHAGPRLLPVSGAEVVARQTEGASNKMRGFGFVGALAFLVLLLIAGAIGFGLGAGSTPIAVPASGAPVVYYGHGGGIGFFGFFLLIILVFIVIGIFRRAAGGGH